MNVKFIDTSVMLNLLGVPNCCSDSEIVKDEWRQALEAEDVLIMPTATIIETGNHIAHIANGTIRRKIAGMFGEFLKKTAKDEAPWRLYSVKDIKNELLYLAEHIEDFATLQIGIGDMSIVYAYEHYIEETPGVGTIMIWSTDSHLKGYCQENVSVRRRRKR